MSDWPEIQTSAIASMFDARLKSVVVISHPRLMLQDELFDLNAEYRAADQIVSELDLSEPGIRLLLGRNGSGKSTLLEKLSDGISAYSGKLETRWAFSVPTEELLDQWNSFVNSATESWDEVLDYAMYEEVSLLEDRARLPILEFLRAHHLDEGNISREESVLFYSLFDRHGPCDYEGRFLIEGNWEGPPTSYSPRRGIKTWFIRTLRSGRFLEGNGKSLWYGGVEGLGIDSNYFLLDRDRAARIPQAFSQFLQGIDSIEFGYPANLNGPAFRFLGQVPDPGPLFELLELAKMCSLKSHPSIELPVGHDLSFPLGQFVEPYPGRVGSRWLNANPFIDSHPAYTSASQDLDSFVQRTVIDLRGDFGSQFVSVWHRLIDIHLKVVIVREALNPSDHGGSEEVTKHGSPAVNREHIIIDGFESLNIFLEELSEDLRDLDIGIDGLRAFRPHDGGWTSPGGPKPGGFFRDLDFGQEVQGRKISQNPKLLHMSKLELQWKQSLTDEWLDISAASQGQQDVILMLLAIASSSVSGANVLRDHLLLIDEFDQHLHATVTTKFLEIAQRHAKLSNTRAILSTHSTPTLQDDSTRQAPRIFARRTVDGAFSYSQRPPETREQLAADLGVDLLSASALSQLFVLVEGEHDEAVLEGLLSNSHDPASVSGVELINARGTWAFDGIWNNVLRYHSAPVLVVYDKRNERLENAWKDLKEIARHGSAELPRWSETEFRKLRDEIDQRSSLKSSQSGDDETDKILKIIFSICGGKDGRPEPADVRRLTFHGMATPDIIRLLPIEHFLTARQHDSWDGVETWWKRKNQGNPWSKEFKKELRLTTASVRTAMSRASDNWHPELQRIYNAIIRLHMTGGPTNSRVMGDHSILRAED